MTERDNDISYKSGPRIMDKLVSAHDLELIVKTLRLAELEIHNPGAARHGDYDLLDLIDQAKAAARRAQLSNVQIFADLVRK